MVVSEQVRLHDIYLHPCFDHIHWCVPKYTGSPCNSSSNECLNIANVLGVVSILQPLLDGGVDKEPDGLVGALLDDGGCQSLVGSP